MLRLVGALLAFVALTVRADSESCSTERHIESAPDSFSWCGPFFVRDGGVHYAGPVTVDGSRVRVPLYGAQGLELPLERAAPSSTRWARLVIPARLGSFTASQDGLSRDGGAPQRCFGVPRTPPETVDLTVSRRGTWFLREHDAGVLHCGSL